MNSYTPNHLSFTLIENFFKTLEHDHCGASQDVSNLVGECYEFPSKETLMEYKILVTTLLTAGR